MKANDLRRALEIYAAGKGLRAAQAYYIRGEFKIKSGDHVLYSDEGLNYCFSCATSLLEAAQKHMKPSQRETHMVCETDLHDEDVCQTCETCGKLLNYYLNSTGVEIELDHFRGLRFRKALPAGDAFCIARILEAAPDDKAAQTLARRAAKHISASA